MQIAIDARDLANVTTGVGRYLLNLLQHFPDLRPDFVFTLYTDRPIPVPQCAATLRTKILTGHPWLWKQVLMPIEQKRAHMDLFFVPSYSTPVCNPAHAVVTIHDMIYTRYPQWTTRLERWRFATIVRYSARFASRIIAVSEATRKDILTLTGVSPRKVKVIYEGVDPIFRELPAEDLVAAGARLGLALPFILYVGSLHHRRNVKRLLQAFAQLQRAGKIPHRLVLCGLNLFEHHELEQWVTELQLAEHVKYFGYVTDEDLVALYNLAELFVYPSMYEGFGLPVLEAMACGTPVITGNSSSLPEVAGDAALLVDPHDTLALSRAMASLIREASLRQELRERGQAQCRKFAWRTAAAETLDLFAEAAT